MLPEDRPQSCGLTPAQSSALVLRGSSSQRASPCWAQPAGSQKVLEAERLSLALLSSARVARLGPSSSPAPHPAAPGPCHRRRARRGAGRPSAEADSRIAGSQAPPRPGLSGVWVLTRGCESLLCLRFTLLCPSSLL